MQKSQKVIKVKKRRNATFKPSINNHPSPKGPYLPIPKTSRPPSSSLTQLLTTHYLTLPPSQFISPLSNPETKYTKNKTRSLPYQKERGKAHTIPSFSPQPTRALPNSIFLNQDPRPRSPPRLYLPYHYTPPHYTIPLPLLPLLQNLQLLYTTSLRTTPHPPRLGLQFLVSKLPPSRRAAHHPISRLDKLPPPNAGRAVLCVPSRAATEHLTFSARLVLDRSKGKKSDRDCTKKPRGPERTAETNQAWELRD